MTLFRREPPPPPEDPADILSGRCTTCKAVIEVERSQAQPPTSRLGMRNRLVPDWSAHYDLWSVECPVCRHNAMRLTNADGSISQEVTGPKVYLTKKG